MASKSGGNMAALAKAAETYVPVSTRLEALLSLLSIAALIIETRSLQRRQPFQPTHRADAVVASAASSSSSSGTGAKTKDEAKAKGGKDTTGVKDEAKNKAKNETKNEAKNEATDQARAEWEKEPKSGPKQEEAEFTTSINVFCPLLLAASELMACHELFKAKSGVAKAATKVAEKAGKSGSRIGGPLGALIQGVAAGSKASKSSTGVMARIPVFAVHALATVEAFEAAHGLVMLIALGVSVAIAFGSYLTQKGSQGGISATFSRLLRTAAFALPTVAFVYLRKDSIAKLWRSAVAEGMPATLRMPFRVAALAITNGNGMPTSFAVLQMASMLLPFLTEGLKVVVPLVSAKRFDILFAFDSPALSQVFPCCLGILFLAIGRFRRTPDWIIFAMVLAGFATPLFLAMAWPTLAGSFGAGNPEGLIKAVSLAYVGAIVGIAMAGGPLALLSGVVFGQLVAQLHDPEVVVKAVSKAIGI